jgi:hypothetical protein
LRGNPFQSGLRRAFTGCLRPADSVPSPSPLPALTEAPDLFATVVRPVLKTQCSPCHEPGGKLYDRLPFDNPKVVSSHSEKVLRRLKGEDREAVERWLATIKPAD